MNPTQAIHIALNMTTRKAATLVGEHEVAWSMYRHGKRTPSTTKVQGWLESLARNGIKMQLHITAEYGCEACWVNRDGKWTTWERHPPRTKT